MWQLVINGPGYFDTPFELPEGTTDLGRADENAVVLSGDKVSRRHARLHVRGATVLLEDLGSRNGVRLNGVRAVGTQPLQDGDVLKVGENTLLVKGVPTGPVPEADGQVHRFGRGVALGEALVMARSLKEEPFVLKALDNFAPTALRLPPPVLRGPDDTEPGPEGGPPVSAPGASGGERTPLTFRSLALLYQVAETLARATRLPDFLARTLDLVMKRVGALTGVVLLTHPSGGLVPAAVRHAGALARGEVPVSDAVLDAALAQGQAIAVAGVRDDRRFAGRRSVLLYGVDQVLCFPIGQEPPFLGVLYLNRDAGHGETVDQLLDVCTAITQLLQTGIQRFQAAAGTPDGPALERFLGEEAAAARVLELGPDLGEAVPFEERQVTALHLELEGVEARAAALPPRALAALLDGFQDLAAREVLRFEGALTGFGAGRCQAVFGALTARPDDALRAVRAALAVRSGWERLVRGPLAATPFPVRAGLTGGRVLLGTSGTPPRVELHVLGEAPAVAAAVAAAAASGQVLLSARTLSAVGARFDTAPLGERPLGASRQRLALFEVLQEGEGAGG